MMSSAWSHGTSRSATSTVPCTAGSMTMFRPLISANVRSTARRSAPWKSRLTGCPVKLPLALSRTARLPSDGRRRLARALVVCGRSACGAAESA